MENALAEADINLALGEPAEYSIELCKDLRRIMYRYLEPQDWVRVVGKRYSSGGSSPTLNQRSGLIEWKAAEISKLSPRQVDPLKQQMALPRAPKSSALPGSVRVLICQKSDCRRRGSLAVSQAMAAAILQKSGSADAGHPKMVIQATGCMKRCQTGPNVVMVPGGSHSRMTPEAGRSLIHSAL